MPLKEMMKIGRDASNLVATGKGHWVSRLTSRGIPIARPSLEENPELSLTTRQES